MIILNYKAQTMRLAMAMRRKLGISLACALMLLGLDLSTAKADRRYEAKGTEFDLIPKLVGDQLASQSAISLKGGYIVWQDNATDESGYGVSAIKLDINANPVGSPFRVNTQVIGDQEKPQVGVLNNGGAFFAWEAGETGFRRVQFRVSNELGFFSKGEEFATGADSGEQTDPSLAVLRSGDVMLSWTDYLMDGDMKGLSAKLVDSRGETLIGPFRLNKFTLGNQYGSKLQALPNGGVAAVWISDQQQDEKSIDVIARVFNSLGQPITDEVVVSKKGISSDPVIGIADDKLIIAWEQVNLKNEKTRWDIHVGTFDMNLKPVTAQVIAHTRPEGDQFNPKLQGGREGALMVWNSLGQDGSRETVMGRFINNEGLFAGIEFRVNTQTIAGQIQPNVSANANGEWLVTWSTPRRGNVGTDVVGQRFEVHTSDIRPLDPISIVFVNSLNESDLLISWPRLVGMDIEHFEVYMDNIPNPKIVHNDYFIWKGLEPGREYAYRVSYLLKDGRKSPLSEYGFNRTWGRDYNKDGLPDDWQRSYFGNNNNLWPIALEDSDGDGVSNKNEFLAGTDPTDRVSTLKINVTNLYRGQRLSWKSELGSVYQLERTGRLESGGNTKWVIEGDPVIAVDGESGITVEVVENIGFYRVKRIR